jgi:hypothetical protein
MERTLLFITTGEDPEQRSRSELLLCRILLCAPRESFLFQRLDRIGIVLHGSTSSARRRLLWGGNP